MKQKPGRAIIKTTLTVKRSEGLQKHQNLGESMTEQDKKKFKTVPAMDMDEYKQKIREHRLKILKRTLVTALIIFVIIAGLFLFLALRHYEDFDVNSTVERSDTAATIF